MTVTTSSVLPVDRPMLLAIIDIVKRSKYPSGIIGVLGRPDSAQDTELTHEGQRVVIRAAGSALAAREVLREHRDGDWTVIVTDRSEHDLGAGVLAHLVGNNLRRPNAWEAIRQSFSATGVAPSLTKVRNGREVATGLLAAKPATGWPPAPAGVLTRAHAFSSVAREHLGLVGDVIDAITVLNWSVPPQSMGALERLREDFGDALADAMLDWVAESTGPAETPVRRIIQHSSVHDLVPIGLALSVIGSPHLDAGESQVAALARVRLEPLLGKPLPSADALSALGSAAVAVVSELARNDRNDAHVERILQRADQHLADLDAASLTIHSDLLASGFRRRLALLGATLRRGVAALGGPSEPAATEAIEKAWRLCERHRLAQRHRPSGEVVAFRSAVRLWRWLVSPELPDDAALVEHVRSHLDHGAWADAAINDVDTGVDDEELSTALHLVYDAAVARRQREEHGFARRLAQAVSSDLNPAAASEGLPAPVWNLEALMSGLVMPMAKKTPTLLLVMDGMSAAAATEIIADATGSLGWVEAGASQGASRRAGALAVLPSLTEVSRASLLCGTLTRGGQDVERAGYAELTQRAGKISAALFHKKGVDTTRPGALVADGVGAAIDDREGTRLVTVVLNSIDDALDRSDPVGKVWATDEVKHLSALLSRARAAGRTVIMTADHGHVVERRRGDQRPSADLTSGRSRGTSAPAQDDEVLVIGRRVLTDDHSAILAVREGLRYGPLKAGYHGGASAQEVVVPVVVLLPDDKTNDLGLPLLAPQEPLWWSTANALVTAGAPAAPDLRSELSGIPSRGGKGPVDHGPTLFDEPADAPADGARVSESVGAKVCATDVYAAQRKTLPRLAIRDDQVRSLLDALSSASGARLSRTVVATTLGVPAFRVDGALSQVRQLLNVEGYNVVGVDADGQTVVLDQRLLREQFGVSA
ncbi:hypothetical protein N864_11715 [Intrasporangium chromatireducens Q5-1]|uniref:Uncharacterized protein n=1 Tax=Intrasporangium chromatireducens Q5-1 TaxID=584657 RepID=W9GP28_9MICO|nr:BREX-2 system phosphatase PglZ [Intrasporangium chromatireducens]EWT07996.1 hypothetical protein N864_11715 [Intrasporangium chromatireducens Q5-1]